MISMACPVMVFNEMNGCQSMPAAAGSCDKSDVGTIAANATCLPFIPPGARQSGGTPRCAAGLSELICAVRYAEYRASDCQYWDRCKPWDLPDQSVIPTK